MKRQKQERQMKHYTNMLIHNNHINPVLTLLEGL